MIFGALPFGHIGKMDKDFLRPDGRKVDLQGLSVEIHNNGIEFLFMPCSRRVHA